LEIKIGYSDHHCLCNGTEGPYTRSQPAPYCWTECDILETIHYRDHTLIGSRIQSIEWQHARWPQWPLAVIPALTGSLFIQEAQLLQRYGASSPMNDFILPLTSLRGIHCCRWQYAVWQCSEFDAVGPERSRIERHNAKWRPPGRSRSLKVTYFGTDRKPVYTTSC